MLKDCEDRTFYAVGGTLAMLGAEVEVGNIVNRIWIVYVICGDLRGFGGSGRLGVCHLPLKVLRLKPAPGRKLCGVE